MIKFFRRSGKVEPVAGLEVHGGPADGAFFVPDTSQCCCILYWVPPEGSGGAASARPEQVGQALSLSSGTLTAAAPEPDAWGIYELHDVTDEGGDTLAAHYCYVPEGVRVAMVEDEDLEQH